MSSATMQRKRSSVSAQLRYTTSFEIGRNLRKFIGLLAVYICFFALNVLISELQLAQGSELPATSSEYATGFLGNLFSLVLVVGAVSFGGSIIAEDYEKQTANLLFPKVTKTRLLTARFITRALLYAILIVVYYVCVSVACLIQYSEIPEMMWTSMGWAILYSIQLFAFATFMSSFGKRTSTAIITALLILLIAFNMIETILMATGSEIEPLFSLTYFGNIISNIFDMPAERMAEILIRPGLGEESPVFTTWITPSVTGALIGLSVYIVLFLMLSVFIYQRRQTKQ